MAERSDAKSAKRSFASKHLTLLASLRSAIFSDIQLDNLSVTLPEELTDKLFVKFSKRLTFFFQKEKISIEEAVKKIADVRHHIVLREVHLSVLRDYEATLEGNATTVESSM